MHTQILSVVTVIDRRHQQVAEAVERLHQAVSTLPVSVETIVMLNPYRADALEAVRALSTRLPNLQVYALKTRVDFGTAIMAGMENAIGDWIATVDLATDDPALLGPLFEASLREGTEVALAIPDSKRQQRGIVDRILSNTFHRVFRTLHGYTLTDEAPSTRLFTRGVTNSLLQHDSPLIALETLTATGGYRKTTLSVTRRPGLRLPVVERVRARWRTLIGIDSKALRIGNLLCGLGAVVSVLYSLYTIGVYLFKDDVMEGWTTVSLMLSFMFFLISLVLWLLSEYMVLLLDASARRPQYEIAEEFCSNIQTRREQLNVEVQT
jgi:hypothetical protein